MVEDITQWRVLIPARSGSKGIRDKNIAKIGGLPLIAHSILVARQIFPSDRIWVSTDSLKYAEVARQYGATVPYIRPKELAEDSTPDLAVFQHAIHFEEQLHANVTKYWLHLRPTTPQRSAAVVKTAMSALLMRPEASGLRSVHRAVEVPQKWCSLSEGGYLESLCGDSLADVINHPRQSYLQAYIPNGYADVIKAQTVRDGYLHGRRCLAFETMEVTDIDHHQQLRNSLAAEVKTNADRSNFGMDHGSGPGADAST